MFDSVNDNCLSYLRKCVNQESRNSRMKISKLIFNLTEFFISGETGNEPYPVWKEIGWGFFLMSREATNEEKNNSSWITNGTFLLPHEWLSRRDEIKIPHERRSREWGIFILSQLLSHEWGSRNVPWVMNEEFIHPWFLSRPGMTFPNFLGKLLYSAKNICPPTKINTLAHV